MKRFFGLLAGLGLLTISMTGCHHTAGACDCTYHGHGVVGHAHPALGAYSAHPIHSGAPVHGTIVPGTVVPGTVLPGGGGAVEQMPKAEPKKKEMN